MYSCNCSKRRRLTGHREADHESRSFGSQIAVTDNFAAMFADDAITNTQAEASPLADVFGGKEGIKNAFGVGDPRAVVRKGNFHERAGLSAHNLNAGGPPGFADRVIGIIQDVKKYLLQLVRISHHLRQRFVEMFDNLNAM